MTGDGSVVLAAWREVAREPDLQEGAAHLLALLTASIQVETLVIRRLDVGARALDTVAVAVRAGTEFHAVPRSRFSPDELEELLAWMRRGEVLATPDAQADTLARILVPSGLEGAALAGPLVDGDEPLGVIVLLGESLGAGASDVTSDLLEPFTVAMSNDRRHHELMRLRAAAGHGAQRIGRDDLSDAFVGREGGLREVIERVEQVAPTDVPVLLLGESGSGKEVVARAIHVHSPRASGPMLRVNCGAIPAGLVDSELFGHERGSFTGAVQSRQGWFERADGGTLFLDEVAELTPDAQVRLLRVLQDGLIERVGGQHPVRVDVRIVAATHRNLEEMIAAGTFRADLWYRLAVFPLRLPPLRDRLEDVPALATHFAARVGRRLSGRPLLLSPSDVALLQTYDWPGNVRELAAVIERAAVLGSGQKLELAKALGPVGGPSPRPAPRPPMGSGLAFGLRSTPNARPDPLPGRGGVRTFADAAREHIAAALRASQGRIEGRGGAAQILGMHPATLRSKMKRLQLDWTHYRPER
jgi:hydrogenase-4 transcriptional activator